MNGRVYDPLIAVFLSPDNYVQNPDLTQNFNRYGYCINNPLKYADPSGMMMKARDESDAAFDAAFTGSLADGSMSFGNMAGGGGYGGGHYGTMGSGVYDVQCFSTEDVLGSIWNDYLSHNPVDNVLYSYINVNGDWYNAYTTTFNYPSNADNSDEGLDNQSNRTCVFKHENDFLQVKGLTKIFFYTFTAPMSNGKVGGVGIDLAYDRVGNWIQIYTKDNNLYDKTSQDFDVNGDMLYYPWQGHDLNWSMV